MDRIQDAEKYFADGRSCSQAVFAAFAPSYGIDAGTALRLAAGLGGGMRVGGTCGAALGAVLVLGLHGYDDENAADSKAAVSAAVESFLARFEALAGAIDCPGVLGCDMRTDEGREHAKAEGLRESRCVPAVRAAARLLEEMTA